ncbi:MAG: ABC transporter ATP-binding protein/permease [Bacteroidales bacterium]|jgi:subfamily B ATP-binding cassette protein MsbA|nr:ABC transporter ATP-binding protein/permease [Bacteroidales bacterium]
MNNIRLLLKYFAPYKWSAVRSICYNILGGLFSLMTFSLVAPFLKILFSDFGDAVRPAGQFSLTVESLQAYLRFYLAEFVSIHGKAGALALVVFVVIGASFFKNAFIFLSNNSMAYIRACTVRDLRQKLYDKFTRLSVSYFTDARKGDVMTRISNDVQEIEISVVASLTMMFRDPLTIVMFVVYLFAVNYQLTLFAMLLLPLSGWFIGRTGKSLRSTSFEGQASLGKLLTIVDETLTGLRIVKVFNAEDKMKRLFRAANERYSKIFKRVARKHLLASPLSEFLSTIVVMILLYAGGKMVLGGKGLMSPEMLIAYIVVFSQIIPPAKSITSAWFSIQKGMASIERIDEILKAEEKITEKAGAISKPSFEHSIEFRDVWYAYNSEPVLKDINLTINKGETVAIVGRSGAGKSTLADLLPRLIDVDRGAVMIDGIDVRDIKQKDLRHLMGIVSQTPILFNAPFRENIAFGLNSIDMQKVEEAARIANAHEFIMDTESGYDSLVGESGNKLSGGQRQRVSIARAIMTNPPLLILDEATSALDTESERLVQDAILKLMESRTSLVIAHRLSTIQRADKIVVLDEGRIVETGRHEELIAKPDGFYKKLYSYQS